MDPARGPFCILSIGGEENPARVRAHSDESGVIAMVREDRCGSYRRPLKKPQKERAARSKPPFSAPGGAKAAPCAGPRGGVM
jgi:hypothetical protein